MSKTTATNSKQTVKAIATAKQTASNSKKQFDINAINAKIAKQTADKKQNSKQTADSKKQTASNSKKQNSKKQTADSKQTATADSKKLSVVKSACRTIASFANSDSKTAEQQIATATDASNDSKQIVQQLIADVQHDDFLIVCKDTTACAMFIVDNNLHTICNVYDCLRIQFTTAQAKKYADLLLSDSKKRFHYRNDVRYSTFIEYKCTDYADFISAMNYVYTVYMNSKQTASTTATEQTAEQQIAK